MLQVFLAAYIGAFPDDLKATAENGKVRIGVFLGQGGLRLHSDEASDPAG